MPRSCLLTIAALALGGALLGALVLPVRAQAVDVPALIIDGAARHGVDSGLLLGIAWCESRFAPFAVGPWGHVGVYQWDYRSFLEEARWYGVADVSPWDPYWNVELAAFATSNGRAWRWNACR